MPQQLPQVTPFVTGLENKYYFINNPVWASMQYMGNRVDVQVKQNGVLKNRAIFNTPTPNRGYQFDITPLVKSVFYYPQLPAFNNQPSADRNIEKLTLVFKALDTNNEITIADKYFVRGGYLTGINLSPTEGMLLSDTNKIPVWNGKPARAYKLNNGEIDSVIPSPSETKVMNDLGCDSLYVAFLNGKGGYSYWNFEKWELSQETDSSGVIQGEVYPQNHLYSFHQLGGKTSTKIKLTSRFQGEFLELARALAKTNAAYVYKIADKLKGYPNAPTWKKIKNTGNAFKTKSMSDMQELSFEFDLMTNENTTLLW